ncbi:MAG TPA: HD domain-containing protein [Candidatus Limnocylindrales bacterium]|nr:HD domain-containing protein [Candidatus Limnocylindrales bacterium]
MTDLSEPTTPVARAAANLAREVSPPFLYNHSARSFAWACLIAEKDRIAFDRELLYVGAILHDIGLTPAFDGPRCFENEGAVGAAAFAREQGWDGLRAERLAEAIRLHMHPRVVVEDSPEGFLLDQATGCDCRGHRIEDVDPAAAVDVIARYPWLDFTGGFIALVEDQARRKPGCLVDIYLQNGFADKVRNAPFDR